MRSSPRTARLGVESAPASRRTRGFITSYREGRTCAEAGCGTMLSRYNKALLCWQHADELERTLRRGSG